MAARVSEGVEIDNESGRKGQQVVEIARLVRTAERLGRGGSHVKKRFPLYSPLLVSTSAKTPLTDVLSWGMPALSTS